MSHDDEPKIDTSDVQCALVCMIVSNPSNQERRPGWQRRVNDLIRALRDERNALRSAPGTVAPEGWKLVPIFPTEKMSNAGTESIEREYTESDWETSKDMAERLNADQVWAAMIAAAPSPPASETA